MKNQEDQHSRITRPLPISELLEDQSSDDVVPAVAEEPAPSAAQTTSPQDDIPTPRPFPVPSRTISRDMPREVPTHSSSKALWFVVIMSLLISIGSLALNGVLIYRLMSVQGIVKDGLDTAIASLNEFGGEGLYFEYRFQDTIPFVGDIPFQQDMVFPFQGDIPIDTVFTVPFDAGALGTFNIDVPIDTSFYVDLEVPISVDQTFHVETEVPVDMVIPISISPDDPLIQNLLGQIEGWLVQLKESF